MNIIRPEIIDNECDYYGDARDEYSPSSCSDCYRSDICYSWLQRLRNKRIDKLLTILNGG